MTEIEEIQQRYARRAERGADDAYDPILSWVSMTRQERERALVKWIVRCGLDPVRERKVLEVGCGHGGNLMELIRLGFRPENLTGIELLEGRAKVARACLPAATNVVVGDGCQVPFVHGSFDVVLQSTVFSSILDDGFQAKLAKRMWQWAKPGGGVLWYDFIYNNPRNPDVRGVPVSRIRALFPEGDITVWRLTLAPPISRFVTRLHPSIYTLLNAFVFLRTHVLCWVRKPGA